MASLEEVDKTIFLGMEVGSKYTTISSYLNLYEFFNFRQLYSTASSSTSDDNIMIEMINSPRTQKDFTRLKSNVRIWKEIQVKS